MFSPSANSRGSGHRLGPHKWNKTWWFAREITERIYSRRRQLLGLEPFPIFQSSSNNNTTPIDPDTPPPPFSLTPQEQLQRELDGAIVLVGRSTLKEFQWGLREGWTTPCTKTKIDRDESLARILADDGTFDELEKRYEEEQREKREKERGSQVSEVLEKGTQGNDEVVFLGEDDGAGAPLPSRLNSNVSHMGINFNVNPAFNPNNSNNNLKSNSASSNQTNSNSNQEKKEEVLLPPDFHSCSTSFTSDSYEPLHGWRNIPIRLVGFFNHRKRFEMGGKEGVRIALSFKENAREIEMNRTRIHPEIMIPRSTD
ncbi:hypothetical protein L7F22_011048 [Adiantum nelumboides]|nr:hypothetical protein [Adiantum nelumboides]